VPRRAVPPRADEFVDGRCDRDFPVFETPAGAVSAAVVATHSGRTRRKPRFPADPGRSVPSRETFPGSERRELQSVDERVERAAFGAGVTVGPERPMFGQAVVVAVDAVAAGDVEGELRVRPDRPPE